MKSINLFFPLYRFRLAVQLQPSRKLIWFDDTDATNIPKSLTIFQLASVVVVFKHLISLILSLIFSKFCLESIELV